PHGVDLVDEHDGWRVLLRLGEQLAHAGRADPDEHLDELRRADAEERHARLAGDRAREQGLAGARRTHEQDPAWHFSTQPTKPLRLGQELHDLLQIALGRFETRDVVEGDLDGVVALELAPFALYQAAEWST